MRDLELRGAGNLLGDEQSGHVAALGFELYMQMLDEAVAAAEQAAGEGAEEMAEPVRLDVNVDAYVPADYIPYEQAKIDVHRRIAGAVDVADLELLREELDDRFGALPAAAVEPHRPAAGADQARPGRRDARDASAAAASPSRRSSSTPCARRSSARRSPRRSTSRARASSRCACPTIRAALPRGRPRRGRPARGHARGRVSDAM